MMFLPSDKQFFKKLHQDSPFVHFNCIIHQQKLCSKILKLDYVLSLVTKTMKYIRDGALNRRFSELLEVMDNQFTNVSLYIEVHWKYSICLDKKYCF